MQHWNSTAAGSAAPASLLESAVVMTELECRFLANAALQAQIEYARQLPEQRVDRPRRP